jgi:uncharacterized membrane protein
MSNAVKALPRVVERPLIRPVREYRTTPSGVLAAVVIAAFVVWGIAIIEQVLWLFWLGTGVILLFIPIRGLARAAERAGRPGYRG